MSQGQERFLTWLEAVAEAFGDTASKVMFVGGCAGATYPLPFGFSVRPTDDVDCVVNVTRVEHYNFQEQLRNRGFQEASDENVICRWKLPTFSENAEPETISVDIMPADGSILGFRNAWYHEAFANKQRYRLPNGKIIFVVSPLYFIATKLEAFCDRGKLEPDDKDLEDIVTALLSFKDVREEVNSSERKVCRYIRDELLALRDDLTELIPQLVPGDAHSQQLGEDLIAWLHGLLK